MDPIEVRLAGYNAAIPLRVSCDIPASLSVVQALAERDAMFIRASSEDAFGVVIEDPAYSYKICLSQDHVALLIQELANMAQLDIGKVVYRQRAGGIMDKFPPLIVTQ